MLVQEVESQPVRHKEMQWQKKNNNKKNNFIRLTTARRSDFQFYSPTLLLPFMTRKESRSKTNGELQRKWTCRKQRVKRRDNHVVSMLHAQLWQCPMKTLPQAPKTCSIRRQLQFVPLHRTRAELSVRKVIIIITRRREIGQHFMLCCFKAFSPKDYFKSRMKNIPFFSNLGNMSLKFRMENSLRFMNWKSSLWKKKGVIISWKNKV